METKLNKTKNEEQDKQFLLRAFRLLWKNGGRVPEIEPFLTSPNLSIDQRISLCEEIYAYSQSPATSTEREEIKTLLLKVSTRILSEITDVVTLQTVKK